MSHADVRSDTASADDPNEISFAKGEILEILDKNGKWWQARKQDGMVGSTYLCLFSSERRSTHSPHQLHRQITSRSSEAIV